MPPRKAKELARFRISESVNGHDVYQETFDFEQSQRQTNSKRPRKDDESSSKKSEPEETVINVAMMLVSVKSSENVSKNVSATFSEEWSAYVLERAVRGLSRLGKKSL